MAIPVYRDGRIARIGWVRRHSRVLMMLVCVLAGLKFALRGPVRVLYNSGDLRAIHLLHLKTIFLLDFSPDYLASRAWLFGMDPYDKTSLGRMWIDVGGTLATAPNYFVSPSLYPPTTFVLLSPFASLPWTLAQGAWCGFNLVALVVLLVCVHRIAGFRRFETPSLCLIAGTLALEPLSTTVMLGQTSIAVTALAAASILYGLADRQFGCGLLQGLGIALKPHLAIAFSAPYVLARRWKACVATAVTILVLGGVALEKLDWRGRWIVSATSNLQFAFGRGGPHDPWPGNPIRAGLINLRYPLRTVMTSSALGDRMALAVGLVLAIPGLRALSRRPTRTMFLHALSLLTLVQLLVFYHRTYDAVVLVFPLAWALSPAVPRSQSWPMLLGIGLFFLPSGLALQALANMHYIPTSISSGNLWQMLILPYQAWALLVMAIWLAYCLSISEAAALTPAASGSEGYKRQDSGLSSDSM